jgi:predicted dehydrogenase
MATAAAAAPLHRVAGRAFTPSDTLNVGVIGVGSRGQYLMRQFLQHPGVRISALCDIYAPRLDQGREITGEQTPGFEDYREMLAKAPDLDAVIVATPLGRHAEHDVASLEAGYHVFAEKSLALKPEGCHAIRAAAHASDRIFQVGHQYRYAGWYHEAVRRIRNGDLGEVTHIYAYWHRNYNWRRPLPDPSLEHLINWRLYREWSGGLLAELGSHHIETANWIFEATPESVMGTGGIAFYRDGRETYDNVQVIYRYPGDRTLFFSSVIGNQITGFQILVYGTGGTIRLTLQDGEFFYEPDRGNSAVPTGLRPPGEAASASLEAWGDMPYLGPGEMLYPVEGMEASPDHLASGAFIRSVREGTRPVADVDVGWGSGFAVAIGNEAVYSGQPVRAADRMP